MRDEERNENVARTRERVLALIESEFESDAAFERALGLADKTVNNWRRGRSASFMKMLVRLAEVFRISLSDLCDMPITKQSAELSEEELHLLHMYRRARTLSKPERIALAKTIESTIDLYLKSRASGNKKLQKSKQ